MRFTPSDVLRASATAKGVVFIMLEDEAGTVNVICWARSIPGRAIFIDDGAGLA